MKRKLKHNTRNAYFRFLDYLWRLASDDKGPLELEEENGRLRYRYEELKNQIEWG